MKTWYLLAAAVAYYLYSQQTPAGLLAANASQVAAAGPVATIDVSSALASQVVTATPIAAYNPPAVTYTPTSSLLSNGLTAN